MVEYSTRRYKAIGETGQEFEYHLMINSILLFHISSLVCAYEMPQPIQQSAGITLAVEASDVLFSEPQGEETI